MVEDLLSRQAFGRPLAAYLVALAILAGVVVAVKVVERVIVVRLRRMAQRTTGTTDDLFVEALHRSVTAFAWLAAVWLAARHLALPSRVEVVVSGFLMAMGVFVAARTVLGFGTQAFRGYFARRYGGDDRRALVLRPILAVVIWGVALVFVLDNLGVKVSTVLAGLGIGGIAVALAAQAVLSDLFSYIAIVFDRPFAIGDFIVVDEYMGTVERIGIKTTHVRSLGGELLIFGNANLISSRLRNYKPMEKRRVQFGFGLTYESPADALAAVPAVVKEIVTSIEGVTFDRAHFKGFGDSALDFEVVYWVLNPDYNRYMDIQQSINFALKQRLEGRGLAFAFPTRTVHVASVPRPSVEGKAASST